MNDTRISVTLDLTPDQLWALYKMTYDASGNHYEPNPADAHLFASISQRLHRASCQAKGVPDDGRLCPSRGICAP